MLIIVWNPDDVEEFLDSTVRMNYDTINDLRQFLSQRWKDETRTQLITSNNTYFGNMCRFCLDFRTVSGLRADRRGILTDGKQLCPDRGTYSDPNTYTGTNTYTDADTNANPDANTNPNTYTDANSGDTGTDDQRRRGCDAWKKPESNLFQLL